MDKALRPIIDWAQKDMHDISILGKQHMLETIGGYLDCPDNYDLRYYMDGQKGRILGYRERSFDQLRDKFKSSQCDPNVLSELEDFYENHVIKPLYSFVDEVQQNVPNLSPYIEKTRDLERSMLKEIDDYIRLMLSLCDDDR